MAHHWILALTLLGSAFLWLALAARWLETAGAPLGGAILAGAFLLRLALLPLPPALSDDVQRYLWDGKVATAGFNPYAFAPRAGELAFLRDETGPSVPDGQHPSVSPPLSIAAFSIAARLSDTILAWKTLSAALDLGVCALLLRLLRRHGLPEGRAVWYAWNPLAALVAGGIGRAEPLAVLATVGCALCLTLPRRPQPAPAASSFRISDLWGAVLFGAAAILANLISLAALPMWCRQSRRPWSYLAAIAVLLSAALLPVVLTTWAQAGGPPAFFRLPDPARWNGPLALPLLRLLGPAGASWALAGLGLAAVVRSLAETGEPGGGDPAVGTGRLLASLVLLAPVFAPWTLLPVLPFAALVRHPAWLALSALALLLFLPQLAGVTLVPWVYAAVWSPFAALLLLPLLRRPGSRLGSSKPAAPWSIA